MILFGVFESYSGSSMELRLLVGKSCFIVVPNSHSGTFAYGYLVICMSICIVK
jgi:hypothetical protein